MLPKANNQKKKIRFVRSFTKKIRKFDENWRNGRRFLNSANFAPHALLMLAPHSGYALNLKPLIKVSKVCWTSQLSHEILRFSFERKFDRTKNTSQKPASYRDKVVIYFLGSSMSLHMGVDPAIMMVLLIFISLFGIATTTKGTFFTIETKVWIS